MDLINREQFEMLAEGFHTLLEAQRELQIDGFDQDPSELTGNELADFIRWNAYALEDELHEATNEVGWKPWASSRHVNKEAFTKELVDLLHFFANLCLAASITGGDLAELYVDKRQKNLERQERGYTGTDKCSECGRDYAESRCRPFDSVTRKPSYCQEWGLSHV